MPAWPSSTLETSSGWRPAPGRSRRSSCCDAAGRSWRVRSSSGGESLLRVDALDQAPPVEQIDLGGDLGDEAHLLEQGLEWKVRLPPEPRAHGSDQILQAPDHRALAPEVIQEHDMAPWLHHALHLTQDAHRIGHGADRVGGDHRVEL